MDLTTLLPVIIGILIPFLLSMFPGLSAILKAVPKSVWTAMIKAVDPGATITWSVPVAARRQELEARRLMVMSRIVNREGDANDEQSLAAINRELAALPPGGILDTLKSNPMLILAIVGGIIFFVTQKGGCQKPAPPAPKADKPEVSTLNPLGGHPLARAQ